MELTPNSLKKRVHHAFTLRGSKHKKENRELSCPQHAISSPQPPQASPLWLMILMADILEFS